MPSSMRLWALLFVVSSADQTSLMQEVKKPAKSHRNGKSVANLMEAATNMLKNGATPDVVDFTEATLAEITDEVIPAINNASETDQQAVFCEFSQFDLNEAGSSPYLTEQCGELFYNPPSQNLATDNLDIYQINLEETTKSGHHKSCRSLEATKCDEKRKCDMQLYSRWVAWTECEETFKEIHEVIDGQFCVPGELINGEWVGGVNGTLWSFRDHVASHMGRYITQKPICDTAMGHYNDYIETCDFKVTYLDTKSNECNEFQSELESLACRHHMLISDALRRYQEEYLRVQVSYEREASIILQKQNDRIQEFTTLSTVNCLLGRVHERNGRPCDEVTNEIEDELTHCEQEKLEVDYSHLVLVYPVQPPLVPNCLSRDEVVGRCQPVLQPVPCNTDFHQQEYSLLPEVPGAPFSETNPGCNAYPACNSCSVPSPPPVMIGIVASPSPAPVAMGMTVDFEEPNLD